MNVEARVMSVHMSRERAFSQVDVFTSEPLRGNPVAVVLDSQGLSTDTMHAFTYWTNLSESTFVGPPTHPDADYSVRIFCPGRELPFAGHPTLGTCHAWLEAGGQPKSDIIMQECGAGLIPIRRDASGALAFAAPPRLRTGPLNEADVERIAQGLGIDRADILAHEWCDNGPGWQAVLLSAAELVLRVVPNPEFVGDLDLGVVGLHPEGSENFCEIRGFFPGAQGIAEDPVTGSLNAAVGQWLIGAGIAPEKYVAAQGTVLGRAGRVSIERVGDDIWVGGHCTTVINGSVEI